MFPPSPFTLTHCCVLFSAAAITVESIEVLRVEIDAAGAFDGYDGDRFVESDDFIDFDPRDDTCEGRRCIGMLTRVRNMLYA